MSTLDAPPVLHPLEPLSAAEVGLASSILKADKELAPTARFVFVSLHEPPKAAVQAGQDVPREAFIVLYEKAERRCYEAIVSLTDREARLQDFAGAERLFRRIRSAIRHVAKELNDEAGPATSPLSVPRTTKH